MSELNQAADTQATDAKPAKADFVPTTKGQAKMIVDRLRKGITGLHAEIDKREAKVAELLELIETLPETTSVATVKAKVKLEPGTVIEFRYGRGDTASVRIGTIRARKDNEAGNPELYRVESGEGFDAALFTVFPGQIVPAPVADPAAETTTGEGA